MSRGITLVRSNAANGRISSSSSFSRSMSRRRTLSNRSKSRRQRSSLLSSLNEIKIHPMKTVGYAGLQGRRSEMEDTHDVYQSDRFRAWAVYDGHGGKTVSNLAGRFFLSFVMKVVELTVGQMKRLSIDKMRDAITRAFVQFDEQQIPRRSGQSQGSTVILAIYDANTATLITANLGDSRAILLMHHPKTMETKYSVVARSITKDHKPDLLAEKKRITKAGGHVTYETKQDVSRVDGELALSRALGDFSLKEFYNKKTHNWEYDPIKGKVSAVPDVRFMKLKTSIERGQAYRIVLACDGLWDVMSEKQVAEWINIQREQFPGISNTELCRGLAIYAINVLGSTDNVSVLMDDIP